MAIRLHHDITIHEVRAVDGDTIEAWFKLFDAVQVKRRLRIQGIEAGEMDEEGGIAAQNLLQSWFHERRNRTAYLAGGMHRTDQHGRLVGDVLFDTGESIRQLALESGFWWTRTRNGHQEKH